MIKRYIVYYGDLDLRLGGKMKGRKAVLLALLSLLILSVWTAVVLGVYHTCYVKPMLTKQTQELKVFASEEASKAVEAKQVLEMKKLASVEASRALDARLQRLMKAYEDGAHDGITFASPEALFWCMGNRHQAMSMEQFRVHNSMELLFHENKQVGAQWRRVHMAIDYKPSWQPKK